VCRFLRRRAVLVGFETGFSSVENRVIGYEPGRKVAPDST